MFSLEGKDLGSYRLVERVGIGGMAVVYKAHDQSLDRFVAIKLLHEYLSQNPEFATRFHHEARNIARLRHPNILPIYGFGEENGISYFVMDLVDGGTLKDLMVEPLPRVRTLRIITQIADALGYAHSQGIIHRDVKPANVLMARGNWPLLADFGIARVMDETAAMTHTGSAYLGTPHYMAPEQAQGGQIGPPTDQYALAVVMYEMLTGTPPYHAHTPQAIAFQHIYGTLPPPRERNPDISPALEQILLTALSKDPAQRFPDMAAFAGAIAEELGQPKTQYLPEAPSTVRLTAHDAATLQPSQTTERVAHTPIAISDRPGQEKTQGTKGIVTRALGRVPPVWLAAGCAAVVVAGIATAFLISRGTPSKHAAAATLPAIHLFAQGRHHGQLYLSGQQVVLRWTSVPQAAVYRVQIATLPADPSDTVVFRHPAQTDLVAGTSDTLSVVGSQFYYWRVAPNVSAAWRPYSHSSHFAVARPAIGTPRATVPQNGTSIAAARVRLCWTAVRGAIDYLLSVNGVQAKNPVNGLCTAVSLQPGTYEWHVAARARGVRVYVGAHSSMSRFSVRAIPTATPMPQPTATSTPQPTASPAPLPTAAPTPQPTAAPTRRPTATSAPRAKSKPASRPTAVARVRAKPKRAATPLSRTSTPTPTVVPTATLQPLPTSTPAPIPLSELAQIDLRIKSLALVNPGGKPMVRALGAITYVRVDYHIGNVRANLSMPVRALYEYESWNVSRWIRWGSVTVRNWRVVNRLHRPHNQNHYFRIYLPLQFVGNTGSLHRVVVRLVIGPHIQQRSITFVSG